MGDARKPQRIWNRKGSGAAKQRMAELRHAKQRHAFSRLLSEWSAATGKDRSEWFKEAQSAGLTYGCGPEAASAFLRAAIAQAEGRS